MHELRAQPDLEGDLLLGSIVLAFFFLDRSSELWGPIAVDRSTGNVRVHCVKAANVILRDHTGNQVGPEEVDAVSVEVIFESHKGDRVAQGTTVSHTMRTCAQWQQPGSAYAFEPSGFRWDGS